MLTSPTPKKISVAVLAMPMAAAILWLWSSEEARPHYSVWSRKIIKFFHSFVLLQLLQTWYLGTSTSASIWGQNHSCSSQYFNTIVKSWCLISLKVAAVSAAWLFHGHWTKLRTLNHRLQQLLSLVQKLTWSTKKLFSLLRLLESSTKKTVVVVVARGAVRYTYSTRAPLFLR